MPKASEAILEVLRNINATPAKPNVMFEVGIPLIIQQKFKDEVLNGVYGLKSDGVIELMEGNRLRLVKPLPEVP